MKKYEILYDWPIAQIELLCNSNEAGTFADTLGDENILSEFVGFIDKIRKYGDDLIKAKEGKLLFKKWEDLRICFEELEKCFNTISYIKREKFYFFILLAEKLESSIRSAPVEQPDLDEEEIADQMFELRDLDDRLPFCWFVRQNGQSFEDSIVVFSCASRLEIKEKIHLSNVSPKLLFHLLVTLNTPADVTGKHIALIKKSNPVIENVAINAFARLVVLASGKAVHTPKIYQMPPSIIDRDCFRAGIQYQQLNDVFYVLSEYNSREDVLTKYLTLYHVIENFMFKMPIVDLERQQAGRMFSIRDFRRLYKEVDEKELPALKKLFLVTFQLQVGQGATFEQKVTARWDALLQGVKAIDIQIALGALELKRERRAMTHAEFKGAEIVGNFAQVVYAVRNAIVHNKETEFHLTYATLDGTICTLIESFVIPCLEELAFTLVGTPNPHVWYSNKNLELYR